MISVIKNQINEISNKNSKNVNSINETSNSINKSSKNNVNYVKESSLSRLWRHNELHDCGAITAFRNKTGCGDLEIDTILTLEEKNRRNKILSAKLITLNYNITKIYGKYPEGGEIKKEVSYFVVDVKDTGNLENDLRRLGEEFFQDSILFIPKGSIQNKNRAYLIGTNRCENNWLDYGEKKLFDVSKMGYESPIYTSFVNGRPFIFESVNKEITYPQSGMGVWAMRLCAEEKL